MIEKDKLFVYLKDEENENIRKVFGNLNFQVVPKNPSIVIYDLYKNISKTTNYELIDILGKISGNSFLNIKENRYDLERVFLKLHHDEIISFCCPFFYTAIKATNLINYGLGVLRNKELLLPFGARYFLQEKNEEGDNFVQKNLYTYKDSTIISSHDIEIPLSVKDKKLSNIYSGKEKLNIVSTNLIYPEVYEELHTVEKLLETGKHVTEYINTLHFAHQTKMKNMQPYTGETYEPFSPDIKAWKHHALRAQWTDPPRNEEELRQRIQFLLNRIFEIDEVKKKSLENTYPKIIL